MHKYVFCAWYDKRCVSIFKLKPAAPFVVMLAFLAVGAEFRPNIGVDWPGYAASGRERCLVRGVAEDDCAVARTEIAPAEAFHVAVSFRQDIAIGAYIARNLPVAGWQLD